MPNIQDVIFYQELCKRNIFYTHDGWFINIEDFPPFNDSNPIFDLSDLPSLEIPVSVKNVGRKSTSVKDFRLTLFCNPAIVSRVAEIIDENGEPYSNQSVHLGIGEELRITLRFSFLNLDEDLRESSDPGASFAHELIFRWHMQIDGRDLEDHKINNTITISEYELPEIDGLQVVWTSHGKGEDTIQVCTSSEQMGHLDV